MACTLKTGLCFPEKSESPETEGKVIKQFQPKVNTSYIEIISPLKNSLEVKMSLDYVSTWFMNVASILDTTSNLRRLYVKRYYTICEFFFSVLEHLN